MIFLVFRNNEQHTQIIPLLEFTRADLLNLFYKTVNTGEVEGWIVGYAVHRDRPEIWKNTITSVLAQLGKLLLAPVLSALPPETEHIIFLPSDELFLLPLHAVPLDEKASEYLCDRYKVSYVPSIEVLSNIRAKALQGVPPDLYAVINPRADSKLIFTPWEGEAIARLFTQHRIDIGETGTKHNVIAGMHGRTYVHFSCHGRYEWADPARSGLELADACLTLADLQGGEVDLSRVRLVTLSACETSITGRPVEYVSIPAGFMLAGVPCIIGSLWPVYDFTTALLMERFYRNHLNGELDFARALREAQAWVRRLTVEEVAQYIEQRYRAAKQKEKIELFKLMRYYGTQAKQNRALRPFVHPYYWAAFTVNGL